MIYTLDDFREGKEYARIYRDLYGSTPRGLTWTSRAEFKSDLEILKEELEGNDSDNYNYQDDSDLWGDELRSILPGPINYSEDEWN